MPTGTSAVEPLFGESSPSRLVDLTDPDETAALVRSYASGTTSGRSRVLQRVVAVAIANGADTVLIEHRYVDRDWRGEYSALYAGAFREYPSLTHRLHFFAMTDGETPENLHERLDTASYTYVGYSVMRPLPVAPVGRTMLPPPPAMRGRVRFKTKETVHVFGVPLEVWGVPFLSQDAQVARCAHAVAWNVSYFHHLAYGTVRKTVAELAAASPLEVAEARLLPSSGLVKSQLGAILRSAGIGPVVYLPQALPRGQSQAGVVLRYLESGLPVIASSDRHAVTLLGCDPKAGGRWDYVFHDDEAGPYLDTTTGADAARPWTRLFVPVPDKLYLPGEVAEEIAAWHIENLPKLANASPDWGVLNGLVSSGKYRLRTIAIPSNTFKRDFLDRGVPPDVTIQYRQISMPRWIWVVEIFDPDLPADRDVVSELVVDATMHVRELGVLAWRSSDELWEFGTTSDQAGRFKAGTPVANTTSVRVSIEGTEL